MSLSELSNLISLQHTPFSFTRFFGAELPLDINLIPSRDLFAKLNPPAFGCFHGRNWRADALPAPVQSGNRDAASSFEVAQEQMSGHRFDHCRGRSPLLQR